MSRFYLDEIKKNVNDGVDEIAVDDKRQETWQQERNKYGFDSRDTWSLDFTMTEMLYERLCMYLQKADEIVNLSYHTYDFEGRTYTQREMIMEMIENAEIFLKFEYGTIDYAAIADDSDHELELMGQGEIEAADAKKRLWDMWAVVQHQMWW